MKPRDFLNFFKTRTGKLVLFVAIFGGGLLLFSALRDRSNSGEADIRVTHLTTNATDKPQVVQSIERPMQAFRPPPPKPEPQPLATKTNEPPKVAVEKPKQEPPAPQLAPISLVADASAGVSEPKSLGSIYAPYGRLISCETVITVDSASIQTPIVGLVTENIYHGGKLVIPAGTEVHGSAQTDRHRERIASGSSWTLVWQGGEELRLKAIALDREFSGDQEGWGITDGIAGLRGRADARPWLKNVTLGGSYRWSSRGAIGYLAAAPDADGVVRVLDPNKPVYDHARDSLSVFGKYRTKLFHDRVGTTFQLNVNNVTQNGGHLQPTAVNPDGSPWRFRIIDPRQFILSATFDL